MPDEPASEELVDKRYLVLVMRLLVSGEGELQYGELVGVSGLTIGTFRAVDEIPDLVRRWLDQCAPGRDAEDCDNRRPENAGR
ncbi:MAG: hypothetical protein M5U01_28285 [Ardenticatenaceae bacterium]|nr:hypothetical protein [Ardenticatenaceae bacterium]